MFDLLRTDYKRHGSKILNLSFWALCNYRFGKMALDLKFAPFQWLISKVYVITSFIILITSGVELHRETTIGSDFHIMHGRNILIHPESVIGDRCGIMHDVTIGTNMKPGVPVIGNDVFIGAGAKVLGDITVGDNSVISANSLVTVNVPANTVAIGVPAKIIKSDRLNAKKEISLDNASSF